MSIQRFAYPILLLVLLAASPAVRAAGILAPDDQTLPPLRVTDHLVDVEIRDRIALTTVTQTFRNDTRRRLEATYIFPLPEFADLTNFQMTFNGKMVEGEVLPAAEARRIYESIVRRTRDPGLIEFIGRRLLRMRVFPIEPGSDTTVKVSYQQVTRPVSGMDGYHYPLRTRKTSGQAHGIVRFAVNLNTTRPLKNIWSPSHAVEIVRQGETSARIGYEASGGSLEDDFLLLFDTDAADLGLSVVAYKPADNDPGHFVLMLTPKQLWPETGYQPQDVVFVADTSGSMAGEKIEQMRRSLQFCIDQLRDGDRFNVVRFSTGFDVLFPELTAATRDKRAEAQNFVGGFRSAGGTNIKDTLVHVMKMRGSLDQDITTRPFVVVFLTDGQGNRKPDEIMATLSAMPVANREVRIFPFGVGHDVNTILLDRLANDYTGRPTYVQPGENLELVLGDFFAVVSRPVLTNLTLTLPGIGPTEQFPATLGDLYHGQQLVVAGRFRTPATGPVKLTATRDGQQVEYAWPNVAFASTAEATYVPAVWAGRKISYLLDQIRAHGETQEMIDEIVALGREHGLQTPYTSWLVAPESERLQGLARRAGPRRAAPGQGSSGFGSAGGGGGGNFGRRSKGGKRDAPGSGDAGFGGASAPDLEDSVRAADGRVANLIAQQNARMREMRSRDDARAVHGAQKINGRWYHRIHGLLVDEDVRETTSVTLVKFGSDAYFELVGAREDLRQALAAAARVMVLAAPDEAILVTEGDEGIEAFSEVQREQFGLLKR